MTITTVIVIYKPDEETLAFVESYASAINPVVVAWNECTLGDDQRLQDNPAVTLIKNSRNIGLAKALNAGIIRAFETGATDVFLLDQDSRPDVRVAESLRASRARALSDGKNVGLIGPTLKDRKANGVVNAMSAAGGEHQAVSTLSTSGSLIAKDVFETVGPMWEMLFIDGIDHEWCYRAQSRGFCIIQSRAVEMEHDMGDAGINFFGRYKPIHRSPFRHYHIIRNSLWLLRLPHVPKSFSLLELAKMAYRIPVYMLVSTSKFQSLSAIFRGVRDGIFVTPVKP